MKDSARKKLYSIVEINLRSKILAMHTASRVISKFGCVTHQAKLPERPKDIEKNRAALGKVDDIRPNSTT